MDTKQIYTLSKDISTDLMNTEMKSVPLAAMHMPFECIYIDVEKMGFRIGAVGKNESTKSITLLGYFFLMRKEKLTDGREVILVGITMISITDDGKYLYAGGVCVEDMSNINPETEILHFDIHGPSYAEPLMYHAVACAAYIGSSKPDIQENPEQKVIYRPTRDPYRYASVRKWDVGVRYMTERRGSGSVHPCNTHTVSHGSPRPHMRRGHWHTFLTGKGRMEKRILWIPPIAVGVAGKAGMETVPAVVRNIEE